MPLWGTILTVIFTGLIALVSIINFFRSATKEDIKEIRAEIRKINGRIDRHLEQHANQRIGKIE